MMGMLGLGLAAAVVAGAIALAVGRRREPARRTAPAELPPELAGRYMALVETERRIRQTVRTHGLEPVMGEQLGKLGQLVDTFGRLAAEAGRFRTHLQASPPGAVEREAQAIRARLAAADTDEARTLIAQNLAIVEKRQEKLEQIRQAASALKAQLDTLETTVRLIDDQALSASRSEGFAVDLDRVLTGVSATDAALAETRALLRDPLR